MTTPPLESITAAITKIVQESPGQRILGARLGATLKLAYPDFSPVAFQCRNLRQFITSHVPAIMEKGRSGPDLLYGPALAAESLASLLSHKLPRLGPVAVSPFNWRAFSNPNYPFFLISNRYNGDFRVVPMGTEVVAPWVTIPKATSDQHFEIAKEYVSTAPESAREALKLVLAQPKWFNTFSTTARQYGVGSEWAAFRTSRLRNHFDIALKSYAIPPRKFESMLDKPAEALQEPHAIGLHHSKLVSPLIEGIQESVQESAIRRLVQLVVADLPLSDLRSLSLPVGRVFDRISEISK